jgi:hypothetical protein
MVAVGSTRADYLESLWTCCQGATKPLTIPRPLALAAAGK